MIEMILMAAQIQAKYEIELGKKWHDDFMAADSDMKKIMLDQREKARKEAIKERRHQDNIRAQERIADAIRASSFWRF